jgi:hypothetical protein
VDFKWNDATTTDFEAFETILYFLLPGLTYSVNHLHTDKILFTKNFSSQHLTRGSRITNKQRAFSCALFTSLLELAEMKLV